MSLKTTYEFQQEDSLESARGLGWLAAIALAVALALLDASFYFTDY